jgi:hypothetical protein
MKKILDFAATGRIPGIILMLGVIIVVFEALASIVTSFWGALGLLLIVAGWLLLKEQTRRTTTPPPPPAN